MICKIIPLVFLMSCGKFIPEKKEQRKSDSYTPSSLSVQNFEEVLFEENNDCELQKKFLFWFTGTYLKEHQISNLSCLKAVEGTVSLPDSFLGFKPRCKESCSYLLADIKTDKATTVLIALSRQDLVLKGTVMNSFESDWQQFLNMSYERSYIEEVKRKANDPHLPLLNLTWEEFLKTKVKN